MVAAAAPDAPPDAPPVAVAAIGRDCDGETEYFVDAADFAVVTAPAPVRVAEPAAHDVAAAVVPAACAVLVTAAAAVAAREVSDLVAPVYAR